MIICPQDINYVEKIMISKPISSGNVAPERLGRRWGSILEHLGGRVGLALEVVFDFILEHVGVLRWPQFQQFSLAPGAWLTGQVAHATAVGMLTQANHKTACNEPPAILVRPFSGAMALRPCDVGSAGARDSAHNVLNFLL